MVRIVQFLLVSLAVVALAGCAATGQSRGEKGMAQGKCCEGCQKPCCVHEAQDGAKVAYSPETMTLTGLSGKVHDQGCNKDMDAGTYCAKCNRFMVPGTVHCEKCGKDMPKGKYCGTCKQYMGVASVVSYCEHCKGPYATDKGCPHCNAGK